MPPARVPAPTQESPHESPGAPSSARFHGGLAGSPRPTPRRPRGPHAPGSWVRRDKGPGGAPARGGERCCPSGGPRAQAPGRVSRPHSTGEGPTSASRAEACRRSPTSASGSYRSHPATDQRSQEPGAAARQPANARGRAEPGTASHRPHQKVALAPARATARFPDGGVEAQEEERAPRAEGDRAGSLGSQEVSSCSAVLPPGKRPAVGKHAGPGPRRDAGSGGGSPWGRNRQ